MRVNASSFDDAMFQEVEKLIAEQAGMLVPDNFDDHLLGQAAKNAAEANYQRGQEVKLTLATTGWQYIVEGLHMLIRDAEQQFLEKETDAEIVEFRRRWRVTEQIVKDIIAMAESAAMVPHPEELPS